MVKEDIVEVEDNILRQSIYLKAMVGFYLLNRDGFRIRINAGPSYDIMMSAESKDDKLAIKEDDFNNGTFNLEFGGGLDIAFISFDIGYLYGLSNAYDGDAVEIDSRYMGFYFNAGVIFKLGDDDE